MIRATVAAHALDWMTFVVGVSLFPALLSREIGFIGTVEHQLGPLGSLGWKAAGLAVVLACLALVRPRFQRPALGLALLVGIVGVGFNLAAIARML